jgi:hypothetical protein
MSRTIYEEIRPFFSELLDAHGFRLVSESHEPESFGDGLIVLQTEDLRLRFVRDRGQVYADVAPSGQIGDDWHQLQRVKEFLHRHDSPAADSDARRAVGIDELGVWLKANYERVRTLFSVAAYPSARDALKKFEKEKAEQMFGKFTPGTE